jgi:hypothetical protein
LDKHFKTTFSTDNASMAYLIIPLIINVNCARLPAGDVLSGTSASGVHHFGVLEGWFGSQWWNSRFVILLFTTLCVFTPLACFKRVGKCSLIVITVFNLRFHKLLMLET